MGGKLEEGRSIFFWVVREGHTIEPGEKVLQRERGVAWQARHLGDRGNLRKNERKSVFFGLNRGESCFKLLEEQLFERNVELRI